MRDFVVVDAIMKYRRKIKDVQHVIRNSS